MSIAGESTDKKPPSSLPNIFKLDVDCFEEIFEYLSLKDLYSIGRSCKRLQKVTGAFFKQNYSAVKNVCEHNEIQTTYSGDNGAINKCIRTSDFMQFMPIISIRDPIIHSLCYICSRRKELLSTIHICLTNSFLPQSRIELIFIQNILPQIETVQLRNSRVSGDFYEMILKFCTNLKRLYLQQTTVDYKHCKWLVNEYIKLVHLEITPKVAFDANELNEFFTRNPNVLRFSTTPQMLWHNRKTFLNSTAKLDIFEIKEFECYEDSGDSSTNLLNQLFIRGFYKRLFIYIKYIYPHRDTELASIGGLQLLCIQWFSMEFNLSLFTNLRELILLDCLYDVDMEHLARSLVKLERFYMKDASIDDILPFIRHSSTLNKIKVLSRDRKSFIGGVLDLAMLNRDRATLAGARKLTIYIRDDVFLATKWNTKNGITNLSFVEVRRTDSYEWEHQYDETF